MTSWKDKLALTAQRNRQEIVKAKLDRREMMRLGLLTTGGALDRQGGSQLPRLRCRSHPDRQGRDPEQGAGKSAGSRPWVAPMPRLTLKKPVDYQK